MFRSLINRLDTQTEVEAAVEQCFLGAENDAQGANEEYDVDSRTALG